MNRTCVLSKRLLCQADTSLTDICSSCDVMMRWCRVLTLRHTFLRASHAVSAAILSNVKSIDVYGSKTSAKTPIDIESFKPPSVTKILKDTEEAYKKVILQKWMQKKIEEMGEAAFEEYQKENFRRGGAMHAAIHSRLMDEEAEVEPAIAPYMESISTQIDRFHDTLAIEKYIVHRALGYCGVLDCVAEYSNAGLYLIDWKTSERKKTTLAQTFENPLQVAAYVGLWNDENPDQQIKQGMLVMVYPNGRPCDVIKISEKALKMYWSQWRVRVRKYWEQQPEY